MRDFKTVFFRILFVIVIVVCVWQCNAYKKGKTAGVTSASKKATTTTIMTTTTTMAETVPQDLSLDMTINNDMSMDK